MVNLRVNDGLYICQTRIFGQSDFMWVCPQQGTPIPPMWNIINHHSPLLKIYQAAMNQG